MDPYEYIEQLKEENSNLREALFNLLKLSIEDYGASCKDSAVQKAEDLLDIEYDSDIAISRKFSQNR